MIFSVASCIKFKHNQKESVLPPPWYFGMFGIWNLCAVFMRFSINLISGNSLVVDVVFPHREGRVDSPPEDELVPGVPPGPRHQARGQGPTRHSDLPPGRPQAVGGHTRVVAVILLPDVPDGQHKLPDPPVLGQRERTHLIFILEQHMVTNY